MQTATLPQTPINWTAGPIRPRLALGEVHLWRAALDNPIRLAGAEAVLSRDELLRARRFAFPEDQNRFIAAHGALRMILSLYLAEDPESLEFRNGPTGKPSLVQCFTDLRFNLSHSADLALIAVAREREVGVDVELVQRDMDMDPIIDHYFEPEEVWDLRIAPQTERISRFFDIWTRREACLKAEGAGLGFPPHIERYGTQNFCPAPGYAGAVASEGNEWRLACWNWSV